MKVKRFLNDVLQEILAPIRERREMYQKKIPEVYQILFDGSKKAKKVASKTLSKVRTAMGINYFDDKELIDSQAKKFLDDEKNK